jgi:hypothetical protein
MFDFPRATTTEDAFSHAPCDRARCASRCARITWTEECGTCRLRSSFGRPAIVSAPARQTSAPPVEIRPRDELQPALLRFVPTELLPPEPKYAHSWPRARVCLPGLALDWMGPALDCQLSAPDWRPASGGYRQWMEFADTSWSHLSSCSLRHEPSRSPFRLCRPCRSPLTSSSLQSRIRC